MSLARSLLRLPRSYAVSAARGAALPKVARPAYRSPAFHPAALRWSSSSSSSSSTSSPASSAPSSPASSGPATPPDSPALEAPEPGAKPQQLGKIEPRLSMTFTCTAGPEKEQPPCGHRSTHEFNKRSYEKGIVLIQCPECKARHLIADHLGWFKEVTEDGKHKTVEDIMRAKGEKVQKGRVGMDGSIDYAPE